MQNRFENRSKNKAQNKSEKNTKNELNMEPKGLLEFPGKSRKSLPRRPGTSQEPPGTLKGPPRHPTDTKRTPKTQKSHPKDPQVTPKESKGRPQDPQRPPKTPKNAAKTTSQRNQNLIENRSKRHRDSDSTDATLKQYCVENDLSPAECAERVNN